MVQCTVALRIVVLQQSVLRPLRYGPNGVKDAAASGGHTQAIRPER